MFFKNSINRSKKRTIKSKIFNPKMSDSVVSQIVDPQVPVKKVKKVRRKVLAVESEPVPTTTTEQMDTEPDDVTRKRKHEVEEEEEEEGDEILNLITEVGDKVKTLKSELKDLASYLPKMKNVYNKLNRDYSKLKKKQRTSSKTTKCGFSKPTPISDDLCDFFKIPHGSSMSRSECTNKIKEYVNSHDLCVEGDKRKFAVDDALEKILGTKEERIIKYREAFAKKCAALVASGHEDKIKEKMDEAGEAGEVTYFKLQILLNDHIPSVRKSDTTTTSTTSE